MVSSFKVEVTSKEIIKPSSPTPPHLKTLQLSFLDQVVPLNLIPILFFYPNGINPSLESINEAERSSLLKKSLSDSLVRFYPLAGRLQGNTSIDCNDERVHYLEANVSSDLMELIEEPNIEDLRTLLPSERVGYDKNILLGVQVNHFNSGGMVIGVCISHKIADGTAAVTFVNTWASIARGVEGGHQEVTNPKFDGATYFPPRDLNAMNRPEARIRAEKVVTRRFTFDKMMLDVLKEQAINVSDGQGGQPQVKAPTRVEVVSAIILKCVMEANLAMSFSAVHAVNLRARMAPTGIPEDSFGNFIWGAATDCLTGTERFKDHELVWKLREAIRKIDNNNIQTLQNGNEWPTELNKADTETTKRFSFSSWCRFPLYEVNFGWGNPTWVCIAFPPMENTIILLSTRCGEGIEAWITMIEEDIAVLERDLKLLVH